MLNNISTKVLMSDTYFATIINLIVNLWERFAEASFNLVHPHLISKLIKLT